MHLIISHHAAFTAPRRQQQFTVASIVERGKHCRDKTSHAGDHNFPRLRYGAQIPIDRSMEGNDLVGLGESISDLRVLPVYLGITRIKLYFFPL